MPAITANFALLEQAVSQFDGRFTLRVLRSISSTRKSPHFLESLTNAINTLYASQPDSPAKRFLTTALGQGKSGSANGDTKAGHGDASPEAFVYLAILVQVGNTYKVAKSWPLTCDRSTSMTNTNLPRARSTHLSW